MNNIPFNKPYIGKAEIRNIKTVFKLGKLSGDGTFTKKCNSFFCEKYNFNKVLLTTSCTDALEMCALLINIQAGDEIIMPSYTFVSTANAFALRGAKIIFADSSKNNPNIDANSIEPLITPKTKAIVVVHYAGIACDMDKIMQLSKKYNLFVIEDAAQAIDSYYKNKPLGSFGHLAAFSFHDTKNIISGEGGMLVINDKQFEKRAEIIREKGTNRSAFFRGEVDKYGWVDLGSSFLPSEIIAAVLYAQLEKIDNIQSKRKEIWNSYYEGLRVLEEKDLIKLPNIPGYATNNAHMFYIICKNLEQRDGLLESLKNKSIGAVFHYLSLHSSIYYRDKHDGRGLFMSDFYSDCLIRLPFFYDITESQIKKTISTIYNYFNL